MVIQAVKLFATKRERKRILLERARQKGDIIFGAQSIKKQIGDFSRRTSDFDILTKNPKKSAREIEKKFDKTVGFNYFYTKPAVHPGTFKVMSIGLDRKKGTPDDEGIIDYSKIPKPRPKTVRINGVNYRTLKQERQAKKKAIKDPEFKFRRKKDSEDLARIKIFDLFNNPFDTGIKLRRRLK